MQVLAPTFPFSLEWVTPEPRAVFLPFIFSQILFGFVVGLSCHQPLSCITLFPGFFVIFSFAALGCNYVLQLIASYLVSKCIMCLKCPRLLCQDPVQSRNEYKLLLLSRIYLKRFFFSCSITFLGAALWLQAFKMYQLSIYKWLVLEAVFVQDLFTQNYKFTFGLARTWGW